MNTKTKTEKNGILKPKLLLRLWAANMLLVLVAIVFLWCIQIVMFEPNYMNASLDEMYARVVDNAPDLKKLRQIDPYNTDNPLYFLSKTVTGIVFLTDINGEILYAYSSGRMLDTKGLDEHYSWLISQTPEVIAGNDYKEIVTLTRTTAVAAGVPAEYQGEPVALLVYNTVTQIDTMQTINRQQLFLLSIVLTLVASVIAFILARHFTKPIQKIKGAVDRLTEGELTATPQVDRSDELGQLSQSVESLGKELQRVDVLRKEVIANVSHELRAPLALITGYSEMVRDVTGDDPEKRTKNMDLIISEAGRMSQMVNDIMDYSQMQAGFSELRLGTCNLYELVESSVEYGRGVAQQYDITIGYDSFSTEIPMRLDALKIDQVMRNLLNNAINHTENGRQIEVSITNKDGGVCVAVTNPGEEIPPDQLKLIWERYQRVQHQGGHKEGTGIGLAIVSTILTAHDFDYGADSEDGYNCFWFAATKERLAKDEK